MLIPYPSPFTLMFSDRSKCMSVSNDRNRNMFYALIRDRISPFSDMLSTHD